MTAAPRGAIALEKETTDAIGPSAPADVAISPSVPDVATGTVADPTAADAQALVTEMFEATEFPKPELMERIIAAGEAAVEPLLAVLRSNPRDWGDETTLSHAIGLLQVIRHPSAVPALVEFVKTDRFDLAQTAATALSCYGEGIFDTLCELVTDPALHGYHRRSMIEAARQAAGDNPVLRARLAQAVRSILTEAIEQSRGCEPEKTAAFEERDDEFDLSLTEEIALLAAELAGLADPLARELIKTAFAENLIATSYLNESAVDEMYERGGDHVWPASDWLEDYRESYASSMEFEKQWREQARIIAQRKHEDLPLTPPPTPVAPITIRRKEPTVGRNDPCWCGSGKKYKKCHLGK
jgi:SEC-C motif